MRLGPTLCLSLSPLSTLDTCEHQRAFKEENEEVGEGENESPFYLYHLCSISQNGTEGCTYPAKRCRVKEEDELFAEYLAHTVKRTMRKITMDNLKEGNWKEDPDRHGGKYV